MLSGPARGTEDIRPYDDSSDPQPRDDNGDDPWSKAKCARTEDGAFDEDAVERTTVPRGLAAVNVWHPRTFVLSCVDNRGRGLQASSVPVSLLLSCVPQTCRHTMSMNLRLASNVNVEEEAKRSLRY